MADDERGGFGGGGGSFLGGVGGKVTQMGNKSFVNFFCWS